VELAFTREQIGRMLGAVSSITPIDAHTRTVVPSVIEDLPIGPFSAEDLVEAVDGHTRSLLGRDETSRRSRVIRRALVVADLIGLCSAYLIATMSFGGDGTLGSRRELTLFILSLPCWVLVAELHGLYRRDEERAGHATADDVVGVFHIVTVGVWLLLIASRLAGRNGPGIFNLVWFWLLAVCLIPVTRTIARAVARRSRAYEQNTVIVGAGDIGQLIGRKLIRHPEYGANVVGFVDRLPRIRRSDLPEHLPILGGLDRLAEIVERLDIERVVIAFSSYSVSELLPALRRLESRKVQVDLVPWLFELTGPRVEVHSVEGLTLLGLPTVRHSQTALVMKRAIDFVGSLAALVVLSPLMLYIAIRIRRDSPGPVLFRQTRLGAGQRAFTPLKFRTMKVGTDTEAHRQYISRTIASSSSETNGNGLYKLDRADAITEFGAWLRKTSLDELPQLVNVLRGEMSLVGPRPCIPYELENFSPHHMERFDMPQGLTGLWQVTARANATYGEALDMDVAYVRGWSLGLDLRLLLRTPLSLIRQRSSTA
jgi:exopolysaccharide biosynthesis polyprenyl glycosylphosphotransferase